MQVEVKKSILALEFSIFDRPKSFFALILMPMMHAGSDAGPDATDDKCQCHTEQARNGLFPPSLPLPTAPTPPFNIKGGGEGVETAWDAFWGYIQ